MSKTKANALQTLNEREPPTLIFARPTVERGFKNGRKYNFNLERF